MPDTPTQEMIENLQKSVRRWKTIALTFLVGLSLVVVLGLGTGTMLAVRARQEAQAARQAEMEAREQAKAALEFLERDLLERTPIGQPPNK